MKTTEQIIENLNSGVIYSNHNVGFIYKYPIMMMCEYHKDCKYTNYYDIDKFAKRIIKFIKTGY